MSDFGRFLTITFDMGLGAVFWLDEMKGKGLLNILKKKNSRFWLVDGYGVKFKMNIFRILADFDRFSTLTLDMELVAGFWLDEMKGKGLLNILKKKYL